MEDKQKNADRHIYLQIWGIVYLATAVYFLIALTNNILYPKTSLFGPMLGTYFALGMKKLFGAIPQYLFVLFLLYAAISLLRDKELEVRKVISFFLFLIFICTGFAIPLLPALAIPPLPEIKPPHLSVEENLLGCAIAKYIIYPVFSKAVFGAYFALAVSMLITTIYMFRIDVAQMLKSMFSLLKSLWQNLKNMLEKYKTQKDLPAPNLETETDNILEPTIMQMPNIRDIEKPTNIYVERNENSQNSRNLTIENDENENEIEIGEIDENGENFEETGAIPVAYIRPNPSVLPSFTIAGQNDNKRRNDEISKQLIDILEEFNIKDCKVVAVNPGPIVTLFEIEPGKGVKISAFEGLEKDIGVKIGGKSVRIDTIPNKTTIGIEVPNENRETVFFKEILMSQTFQNSKMKLPVIIGKGTTGEPLVEDIAKMPHILIAGQTGSGKSVGINSFIASLLFCRTPEELRMIMIDPKKVEMACYEGIPHLAIPVVTEVENAVKALECAVKEMMYRYDLLKKVGSKNMDSFNEKFDNGELSQYLKSDILQEKEYKRMCYIVIIIDELADLMMTAGKDVETYIQRIAQLARAVGIHLIVATQRPDVKVVTGNIKANLPSRIAFRVMSYTDSRTIIDHKGAEQLLGNGDMLYLKNGAPKIVRYHGAYISEKDVENLVEDIKKQHYSCENMPSFEISEDLYEDNDVTYKDDGYYKTDFPEDAANAYKRASGRKFGGRDLMFEEAARLIVISKLGSTSSIQRHLNLGYARAGRVMDELQAAGIVGAQESIGKPRKVLVSESELNEILEKLSKESE
ncbi:MAG: DNA translocase FtsK [Chitinivibrionia bacterium]|nr:DNA translocase FtsK [Chitinivibrionia bacterium]